MPYKYIDIYWSGVYEGQGYPVDALYLDFQKAFDKVPHKHLVMKLHAHAIAGKVADWIEE